MSFLGKVFGGGKRKQQAPSTEEAIQKLREMEGMLGKKQEYLEAKIEDEVATARKAGTKNKRVALAALRKKKRIEAQLKQIDNTLTTIEFQREALENAANNTEVLKIMGFASAALKNAHQDLSLDKLEDIMDDMQEQLDLEKEISEAFSRPLGFGDEIDEDELLEELEGLEDETFAKEMVTVPSVDHLPEPPVTQPTRPERAKKHKLPEDDDEMKELEQWAT